MKKQYYRLCLTRIERLMNELKNTLECIERNYLSIQDLKTLDERISENVKN